MSNDFDVYGDTDPNNVPDDGAGQDTTAGDGLPGFPLEGYPGWRAGAFGHGANVLGLYRADDADPRLLKISNPATPIDGAAEIPPGYTAVGDGSKYMQDANGAYRLTPAYGRTIHNGQIDWGNIDWPGVGLDLAGIAASAIPLAGATALDLWKGVPGMAVDGFSKLYRSEHPKKDGSGT